MLNVFFKPIRAAFADREKNHKSLVSGGGSGGGGGRAGVVAAADSKMVSADSKMVSADSKLVSANFTGHLQQFYFTSSQNSFFTKIKEILKIHNSETVGPRVL